MPSEQMNQYLLELKNLLVEYFDIEEFEELCFALGLNHEDFIAQKVSARFQKLIVHLHKLHRLDALIALCRDHRPNVTWPDPPAVAPKRPPSPHPVEPVPAPPSWLKQLLTRLRQLSPRTLGAVGLLLVFLLLWQVVGSVIEGSATPTATHPAVAQATETKLATAVTPQPTATAEATTPPTTPPTAKPPTLTPSNTPPPTIPPTKTPTSTPSNTPSPTVPPTFTATPIITPTHTPTLGDQRTRPADGMVMVYVPAGTFMMGSDPAQDKNAQSNEQPQHEVTLSAFWLDRTEVTNAQFATFVAATDYQTTVEIGGGGYSVVGNEFQYINGANWQEPQGVGSNIDGQGNYPVILVSWNDADQYCHWVGGQLPTEAQWEYAARGTDGRLYPWGNTFDNTRLNFCDKNCTYAWHDTTVDDGYEFTAPVGSFSPAGDSWVGAADMAGNVWEWVADWYNEDTYADSPNNNPSGSQSGDYKVLRGGSWYYNPIYLRSANRLYNYPVNSDNGLGFRCVGP